MFFSLAQVLTRGTHVKDRAVSVDPCGVSLASGAHVDADYIVMALPGQSRFRRHR
jgi:hypothetical protein